MKNILIIVALFLISCKMHHSKVVSILDGDTIVLENGEKIRIAEIDCPEKFQPFYREAKQFTAATLLGKEVEIIETGKKSYKRNVATIIIGGSNFADLIVSKGLAHVPLKYCHNKQLIAEYEKAKNDKAGLFAQSYILPYIFRNKKKVFAH